MVGICVWVGVSVCVVRCVYGGRCVCVCVGVGIGVCGCVCVAFYQLFI